MDGEMDAHLAKNLTPNRSQRTWPEDGPNDNGRGRNRDAPVDPMLGSSDGKIIFESMIANFVGA